MDPTLSNLTNFPFSTGVSWSSRSAPTPLCVVEIQPNATDCVLHDLSGFSGNKLFVGTTTSFRNTIFTDFFACFHFSRKRGLCLGFDRLHVAKPRQCCRLFSGFGGSLWRAAPYDTGAEFWSSEKVHRHLNLRRKGHSSGARLLRRCAPTPHSTLTTHSDQNIDLIKGRETLCRWQGVAQKGERQKRHVHSCSSSRF